MVRGVSSLGCCRQRLVSRPAIKIDFVVRPDSHEEVSGSD